MNGAEVFAEFGTLMKNQARFGGVVEVPKQASIKWPLIALGAGLVIGGILVYHWSVKQRDQFQTEILTKLSELQAEVRQKPTEKQWQTIREENEAFKKEVKEYFERNSDAMETLIANLEYYKSKVV